jgi:hypothetical protein
MNAHGLYAVYWLTLIQIRKNRAKKIQDGRSSRPVRNISHVNHQQCYLAKTQKSSENLERVFIVSDCVELLS